MSGGGSSESSERGLFNMKFISMHQLFFTSVLALFSFFAVFFFWEYSSLLSLFLLCISVLMFVVEFRVADVYLYILVGILGALSEVLSISSGAWRYTEPHLFGIPYWLPFLWGIAGVYIIRLSRFLREVI